VFFVISRSAVRLRRVAPVFSPATDMAAASALVRFDKRFEDLLTRRKLRKTSGVDVSRKYQENSNTDREETQ
jgi:hypothetical protein